jgi:hypothetical protein
MAGIGMQPPLQARVRLQGECCPHRQSTSYYPALKRKEYTVKNHNKAARLKALLRSAPLCVTLGFSAMPASAANLTRSVEINETPSAVWSVIGSFCAIKDWLPPVGACIEDGKSPPTRTLVTKDGKASFVEKQTARNENEYSYSYAFVSSPLPVTHYKSTIKVSAKGNGASIVTWTGTYKPDIGKEKAAIDALSGVYEAGLAGIQARFKQ